MSVRKKTRHLSVYLLKENYEDKTKYLQERISEFKKYTIKDSEDLTGQIIIGVESEKVPSWVGFLSEATNETIDILKNVSNKAVLFLSVDNRNYAIPFGYGKFMLNDEFIEYDFGMKIALNSIAPDNLKSVDISSFQNVTIHKRSQSSKKVSKEAFGFNVLNDILRAVTGVPDDENLGKIFSGKDAAVINVNINFSELHIMLRKLYDLYCSEKYKSNYDWYDNLKEVKEKKTVRQLENQLVDEINNMNYDKIHLTPFEMIEWDNIEGFCYERISEKLYSDLELLDYIKLLDSPNNITIDKLRKTDVYIKYSDSGEFRKWKMYKCIYAEIEYDDDIYILVIGKWFKVKKEFSIEVYEYVRDLIPDSSISLIDCPRGTTEGKYNEDAVASDSSLYLLDKEMFKCKFASTSIEFCDLLSDNKQIIHVKHYKNASAPMSHLFSQGRVSALSLKNDYNLRDSVNSFLVSKYPRSKQIIDELIPTSHAPNQSNHYEIVFAVICDSSKVLEDILPFFTLVNFRSVGMELKDYGFTVTKKKINVV